MADSLFDLKFHQSLNGRSNTDTWSNIVPIGMDAAIDSDELRDVALEVLNRLKDLATTDVHYQRISIKQRADNLINKPANMFRTIYTDEKGTRTPMSGLEQAKTAPLELAVEINRDCVSGRGGRMFLRGCVGENEYSVTANSQFDFIADGELLHPRADLAAAVAAFGAALPNGATYVIPDKVDTLLEEVVQHGRLVQTFRLGGLVVARRTRKRISAEKEITKGVQRIINRNYRKMIKLAKGVAFTALEGATLAAAVALTPEIGAAIGGLSALEAASIEIPQAILESPALMAAIQHI